jgi:hypothetical protein
MTVTLKLVRLDDFAADIDSINLLSGGFSLAGNGYAPVVAPIGSTSVHETITLNLRGTSTDDLALMVQEIDAKIKQVQWWLDDPSVERYQVWLRVQMDEESSARQAQLLNIEPPEKVNIFTTQETSDHEIVEYMFGLERTPFWEQPYPYPTTTDKSSINSISGSATLSEMIHGDVPARLAKFLFITDNGEYNKFWLGWRTSRFGTIANFVPVWSLKDGTGGIDTNTAGDGSAYSSTKLNCTFASDATLIQRCFMSVIDASPSYPSDQRGTFTVLLRAKMSDTSIARVRLAYGWMNLTGAVINSPIYRSRQIISGTSWMLYEMGTISIPNMKYFNSIVILDNFSMSLDAERLSGLGSLDLDCLILIPTSDGMVKVTTASNNTAVTDSMTIISPPNMEHYGFKTTAGYGLAGSHDTVDVSSINWSLPANDERPRLIAAGQAVTASIKNATFTISYTYIPRWRTLRGIGLGPAT